MTIDPDVDDIQDFLGATAPAADQPTGPDALPVGLPMPRDRTLLFDPDRRVHATRARGRRFPFPVPNGWFIVARSDELAPGQIRSIYAFARDLVLFRTEGGQARMLDAHCPHLGAHLAVGGRVEDECIRCPFHGWRFDGDSGACTEIPYGDGTRIPARAAARSYPVMERNHMIWAWYHAEGGAPFYDVPVVEEFTDPDWLPIVVREFDVAIAAQEMAENNVDYSHFRYVHGTDAIPEDEFTTEGTYKRAVGQGGNFVREGYGLGLGVLRVKGWVTFLSSTTPVHEELVHVRWIFTAPRANGEEALLGAADSFCDGVSQDIPIWENKIYRPRPVLTRSERPILEHRRWAQQFYSAYAEDTPTTTEEDA
jgi:phenylpropionate dioxygenase-like ring-hydroxylating dioxygenase large terminal subunit